MRGLNGKEMYEDFRQTSNKSVCSQEVSICVDGGIIIIKKYLNSSGKIFCTDFKWPIIQHTLGSCQHRNKCWGSIKPGKFWPAEKELSKDCTK